MKKALFIGGKTGNSYLEFLVLKKIFKRVDIIDSKKIFNSNKISNQIFHNISPHIFKNYIRNYILSKIKTSYDLIYVRSGEFISKKLLLELKEKTNKIVFFCTDNPFVKRDKQRWKLFLPAAKYYDLLIFYHEDRIKKSKIIGLQNTFYIHAPYDKEVHKKKKSLNIQKKNDIVFIGTWFAERGIFFRKLIDLGLNIKIYGTRWEKDPNFKYFKSKVNLGNVGYIKYTKIIQNSHIAIALFSEENQDEITRRVSEITAIGTLLCSYKTNTMLKHYVENKEVVYFKTALECYNKCNFYLKNKKLLKQIALKGKYKTTKILKASNYENIKKIIKKIQ